MSDFSETLRDIGGLNFFITIEDIFQVAEVLHVVCALFITMFILSLIATVLFNGRWRAVLGFRIEMRLKLFEADLATLAMGFTVECMVKLGHCDSERAQFAAFRGAFLSNAVAGLL